MQIIKAEAKNIRQSPRKLRLVADLVRHLSPNEAVTTLKHLPKRAATPLWKTIKQALANGVNNLNLNADNLSIDRIEINEGPTYKRWQAVSRGRAHTIFKRTSHIRVTLKDKTPKIASAKGRSASGGKAALATAKKSASASGGKKQTATKQVSQTPLKSVNKRQAPEPSRARVRTATQRGK